VKRLFKILGWVFSFLVAIVGSALVLSQIKYTDRSSQIRPIAQKLLEQTKGLRIAPDENRSDVKRGEQIARILEKAGCSGVRVDRSETVPTSLGDRNYWFEGHCWTPGGELARVALTLHERSDADFQIDLGHSYCFDVLNRKIRCYTQSLVTLPSR